MDPIERNKTSYDQAAEAYTDMFRTAPSKRIAARIGRFLDTMPCSAVEHPARVLDLGCGTGLPFARTISETGVDVVAIDILPKMLAYAKQNAPLATCIVADMREYLAGVAPGTFNGVVANCSIIHLPRDEHLTVFRAIRRALAPGGTFLFGGLKGDQPGLESAWLGQPFYHSYYAMDTTVKLLEEAGFIVSYAEGERDLGEDGVWIQAVAPAS